MSGALKIASIFGLAASGGALIVNPPAVDVPQQVIASPVAAIAAVDPVSVQALPVQKFEIKVVAQDGREEVVPALFVESVDETTSTEDIGGSGYGYYDPNQDGNPEPYPFIGGGGFSSVSDWMAY